MLCLNMIVKNEEECIVQCLDNVKHLVDAVAIVDTGSTDKTVELINDWMRRNNKPGEVIRRPWSEFGPSRTEALRFGEYVVNRLMDIKIPVIKEELKPSSTKEERPLSADEFKARQMGEYYTGDQFLADVLPIYEPVTTPWYFFFMDADNHLEPQGFTFDRSQLKCDAYIITMKQAAIAYGYVWLIRHDPTKRWCWSGDRHEILRPMGWTHRLGMITNGYINSGREGARNRDPAKYLQDAVVLERCILREPTNERHYFYLAQSYKDANKLSLARDVYLRRATMGGCPEEVYISFYEAGLLTNLIEPENMEKALTYYYKAFNSRPTRLEAAFCILNYYRTSGLFRLGWHFARPLVDLPYPTDVVYVNEAVHRFHFFDDASVCAAQSGDIESCANLIQRALEYPGLPSFDRVRMEKNLAVAKEILSKR